MALKNQENNYLKIANISIDLVDTHKRVLLVLDTWVSENIRINPTGFDKPLIDTIILPNIEFLELAPVDVTKSIDDSIKTACYIELKKLPEYSGWISC